VVTAVQKKPGLFTLFGVNFGLRRNFRDQKNDRMKADLFPSKRF